MTKKKNGFFRLIFSLMPGAGEMYMGFLKQGTSIMGLFFLVCFLGVWLNCGPLMLLLPIVWFYSFFHVHNLAGMSDEEFYSVEDKFIFDFQNENIGKALDGEKGRKAFAGILILIGSFAIWNIVMDFIFDICAKYQIQVNFLWTINRKLPQIVFAVLLILYGIQLIKGKKKELEGIVQKEEEHDA